MRAHSELADRRGYVQVEDPPIARLLFGNTRLAWVWLLVRLWVGYQWLNAAVGVNYVLGLGGKPGKLFDPAWTQTGSSIRGFWEKAVAVPADAKPAIAFDWYREFLSFLLATNAEVWFAKLIVAGELLVGLGLVLGALTGIAAFGGGLMNWSFMMAGTVSVSPLMFLLTVLLILGWKTAGYIGADRYLLPRLGTPWSRAVGIPTPARSGRGAAKRPGMAYS